MAWTTPRNWVAGELVTAAHLNANVRDNTLYLFTQAVSNVIAGVPHEFGGASVQPFTQAAYLSGGTYDKLTVNSDVYVVPATIPDGTYKLEAVLSTDGAGTVTIGIFNLTDAPDTAVVEISSTSATGQRQQSAAITLIANKTYGIKSKVSAGNGWAWGIRLARTA